MGGRAHGWRTLCARAVSSPRSAQDIVTRHYWYVVIAKCGAPISGTFKLHFVHVDGCEMSAEEYGIRGVYVSAFLVSLPLFVAHMRSIPKLRRKKVPVSVPGIRAGWTHGAVRFRGGRGSVVW